MACPLGITLAGKPDKTFTDCTKKLQAAHDILDVLNGKWKMEVILVLLEFEKRRFKELQQDMAGVSAKVLSAVLKDLEANHIVCRKALDIFSINVQYELTDYGKSFRQTMTDLVRLGAAHRSEVMGKVQ